MIRSPNSFEQRAQQQERVAVVPADVFAVDEHARVGAQRVADAEHDRVEERAAPSDRTAGLGSSGRQRRVEIDRVRRTARIEHFDVRRGVRSPANTPMPACAGSGHGASMTRARLRFDERLGLALEALEIAGRRSALGFAGAPRKPAIGSRAAQ